MNYQGKNVLIIGGSSDIGKSSANFFVKCQANVVLTYYHHKENVQEFVDKLKEKSHSIIDYYYVDLCQEESIRELSNYIKNKYSKIDILINNAALSLDNDIYNKTKDEFMKVLETNVVGTFLMMKYFDDIISNGYIFNISSTDGIDTGGIYSIDYNASKAAINNMTKTFSLISSNKIISLCPNWVDTKSTKEMNQEYLMEELKRVNQKELINLETIPKVIDECIKNKVLSGSIIRIEGDEDVRRVS